MFRTHIQPNHCLLENGDVIFKDTSHNDFWLELTKDIFHGCTIDGQTEIFNCLGIVDQTFVTLADEIPIEIRAYR